VGEEKINKLLEKQAIKEFGTFEDVANIIDFYISEQSKMITGQILYLGGVS
jgi:3-oxoacyl-[acyl-carrier protein] reductase